MADNHAEKMNRDLDDLTPLDARNSLLLLDRQPSQPNQGYQPNLPTHTKSNSYSSTRSLEQPAVRPASPSQFYGVAVADDGGYRPPVAPSGGPHFRPMTPTTNNDLRTPEEYSGRQPAFPAVSTMPAYGAAYQPSYGTGAGYRGF